jgi:hypothetical protein
MEIMKLLLYLIGAIPCFWHNKWVHKQGAPSILAWNITWVNSTGSWFCDDFRLVKDLKIKLSG